MENKSERVEGLLDAAAKEQSNVNSLVLSIISVCEDWKVEPDLTHKQAFDAIKRYIDEYLENLSGE